MDLAALSDFHLVATHGGFGKASRASGQAKATLSRRVRELEQSLGVRLIERGTRTLRLTDEGVTLHARTQSPMGEIAEALQDLKSGLGHPSGRLRVSAPLLFAHVTLGPLAAAFAAAFPDVVLEVTAEDKFVDLVADDVDVVIRANPRPDTEWVGRCFLRNPLVLVAPAGRLAPARDSKAQLREVIPAVTRTGSTDDEVWTVTDPVDGQQRAYFPRAVLRLSSPLSVRDAIRAGAGVGFVPQTIAAEDLRAGRLVSWGLSTEPPVEAWALHASRRLVSPKVSAFVDFVCEYFRVGADRQA
ncbi:LysR family transcriptional regulator [Thiomonas sp.]|jgi:DNA-binding transcriptional LysR family regulator|uniref:LysR family transcriptional regulator n=1 Tax=Thiomonas sp. TaxID=2047785 RepID=UPI0026224EED|nr:LysR family transcriptional regulator [Thiomonas sp.]